MNSARRVQIPEGREAETHREDVILEKVAAEPNRFENEKSEIEIHPQIRSMYIS
jgi:hypothetical protein